MILICFKLIVWGFFIYLEDYRKRLLRAIADVLIVGTVQGKSWTASQFIQHVKAKISHIRSLT